MIYEQPPAPREQFSSSLHTCILVPRSNTHPVTCSSFVRSLGCPPMQTPRSNMPEIGAHDCASAVQLHENKQTQPRLRLCRVAAESTSQAKVRKSIRSINAGTRTYQPAWKTVLGSTQSSAALLLATTRPIVDSFLAEHLTDSAIKKQTSILQGDVRSKPL